MVSLSQRHYIVQLNIVGAVCLLLPEALSSRLSEESVSNAIHYLTESEARVDSGTRINHNEVLRNHRLMATYLLSPFTCVACHRNLLYLLLRAFEAETR